MPRCTHKRCSYRPKRLVAILPTIVIALLPKCPFCIMAYTGAMSLCSGKMLYPNSNTASAYIVVILAVFTLLGIALNQRGHRTWLALSITSIAIGLLVSSQFYILSESLYYWAVGLLFFGIWTNGSLYFFLKKISNKIITNYQFISNSKI